MPKLTVRWDVIASCIKEAGPAWLFLGGLASAGVVVFIAGGDEASVRYAGTLLQLAGLLDVAHGLREMRRLFGRPSMQEAVVNWFRRLAGAFASARHVVVGAGAAMAAGTALTARATIKPGPGAPLDQRVTALERRAAELEAELQHTTTGLQKQIGVLSREALEERQDREADDREISHRIEAVAVGGLRLEMVGLAWLMLGVLFTSIPAELASLIARTR